MGNFSWRFPSACGDFSLTGLGPSEDGTKMTFKVVGADLIASERASIAVLLAGVEAKGWHWEGRFGKKTAHSPASPPGTYQTAVILIQTPAGIEYPDVALLLSGPTTGVIGTFTAVRLSDGTVHTTGTDPEEMSVAAADKTAGGTWWERVKRFFKPLASTGGSFEATARSALALEAAPAVAALAAPETPEAPAAAPVPAPAPKPTPVLAVTTSRPTNCCPYTIPGDTRGRRADRLLLAFCTAEQQETWIEYGWLEAVGGITGDLYRIAHRHSPIARDQTKVAWLLTHNQVIHAHATWLPPAEEVLTLKLVIEGHESWVRNPSATLGGAPVLPHPFQPKDRQAADGLAEAGFVASLAPFVGIPVPPSSGYSWE